MSNRLYIYCLWPVTRLFIRAELYFTSSPPPPPFSSSPFPSVLNGHKVDREKEAGYAEGKISRRRKYCFQTRFKRRPFDLRGSIEKRQRHGPEGNSSTPLSGAGVAISFPVPLEYRSTNGIETIWGYITFEEEAEIQLFIAIADGKWHDDPRRPKEDHGKLIFFRLLPIRLCFLIFSLFSANERRNSGIIGLYVSPPRQYTRSHTFLRKEPIPGSFGTTT